MNREQIREMAKCCTYYHNGECCADATHISDCDLMCEMFGVFANLEKADYRKQSEVIDSFVARLKEAPIKCGIPLLGLSTKEEIEEYFNGIMLQVRDVIDNIANEMKGENK